MTFTGLSTNFLAYILINHRSRKFRRDLVVDADDILGGPVAKLSSRHHFAPGSLGQSKVFQALKRLVQPRAVSGKHGSSGVLAVSWNLFSLTSWIMLLPWRRVTGNQSLHCTRFWVGPCPELPRILQTAGQPVKRGAHSEANCCDIYREIEVRMGAPS